jgi:hypothetical protein
MHFRHLLSEDLTRAGWKHVIGRTRFEPGGNVSAHAKPALFNL